MRKNKAKEKLTSGEPVFYCNLLSHAPAAIEVLGYAGVDMVCIDGEHGPLDRQTLEHLVRAAEAVDVTPVVRTNFHYPAEILPFLDSGVMGVKMPHCNSVERARMVVDAVKYAPLGKRGMTPGRANAYGVRAVPSQVYIEASNRETVILVQIEDAEGVKNLPEILQVEGIDIINIGPGDLAGSLGYPGQADHPKVVEVIDHIVDQAYAAGKTSTNRAVDAETRKRWFDKGSRVFVVGDLRLLYAATTERLQAIMETLT